MKHNNNFDMSSTGINIVTNAYHDNWLAREYFEEEITTYKGRTNLYSYNCNVDKIGDFCTLSDSATKQDLINLAEELNEWTCYDEGWTESELREEILNANPVMVLNPYWNSSDFLKIKDEYTLYHTRGYSQGDIEAVLYKGDQKCEDYIDHLFWDSPVSANVEINGQYFDYYEMYDTDYYDWDKNKFINWILDQYKGNNPDYVRETLEQLLPDDYLDYVG